MWRALRAMAITAGVLALLAVIVVAAWVFIVNNVEQPNFEIVRVDGAIEVRDYPRLIVAEVSRKGQRWDAVRAGFRPLANYIFARERGGDTISMTAPVTQTASEKIAMTAPVTQERAVGDEATWTVRFIMPSKYALADLPQPAGSDVRLSEIPARRVAAIRFSGVATDELVAEKEAELMRWVAAQGMPAEGPPTYAYYNDPWTPGFLRRNEVMIGVE
jgi:hypothetical protein